MPVRVAARDAPLRRAPRIPGRLPGLAIPWASVALLSAAAGSRAGEAFPPATPRSVERALEAARAGDAARAAALAKAVLDDGETEDDPGDGEQELSAALDALGADLERSLAAESPDTREAAAWALGWTGRRSAGRRLADMIADPEPAVRREAARALGRLGSGLHEAALVRFAADDDASVRAAALRSLAFTGAGWSTGVRALSDTSPEVRRAAAGLLARVEPSEAPSPGLAAALVRALEDESPVVRACVATTLGRVGGASAVEPLKRAALEADAMVAGAAVEALADVGAAAVDALVDLTGAEAAGGEVTVGRAAKALGRTGVSTGRVLEALSRLVKEACPEVARAAAEALGAVGGEGAKRVLADSAVRRDVRVAVAVAAARLGEYAPAGLLLRDLADADPWVRLAAARGLADMGNPVGFPAFFDALESEDDRLRTYAGACLAVYARAKIDYWEARPDERGRLAGAWRRWWLENRETFVVPGVRADGAAAEGAETRR